MESKEISKYLLKRLLKLSYAWVENRWKNTKKCCMSSA